jgi:hypothetical protein
MANEITIGTNSTGKLTTDGTSYIRGRVNKFGDKYLSGVTILLQYTKGGETSFTASLGTIFPDISTSIVFKSPSSLTGTVAQVAPVFIGSNIWKIPIACEAYGIINLAITWSGSTNTTTAVIADIIYDSPSGI